MLKIKMVFYFLFYNSFFEVFYFFISKILSKSIIADAKYFLLSTFSKILLADCCYLLTTPQATHKMCYVLFMFFVCFKYVVLYKNAGCNSNKNNILLKQR